MANLEAKCSYHLLLLFIILIFCTLHGSNQLQPSQSLAILQIQQLLNFSLSLSVNSLDGNSTDYCSSEPNPSLTLACYQDEITQLHISGNHNDGPKFSHAISLSLFASVSSLSSLKVLSLVSLGLQGPLPASISLLTSLEILNVSSNNLSGSIPFQLFALRNLQTLILDGNNFGGQVPAWLGSLPFLAHLSIKDNSLSGSLPSSIIRSQNLRALALSGNQLRGELPDLCNLTNLEVLELAHNHFGPRFPSLHNRLVALSLRNNSFRFGIPPNIASYDQLQKLDISLNGFIGPFSPSTFSLPSINYLDIAGNKLTGFLLQNMSCNPELIFVNLSSNLLTGKIPACLESANNSRIVQYANNCLSNTEQEQHPFSFCHTEALAVQISSDEQKHRKGYARPVIASSMIGGIAVVGLLYVVIRHREKISENCRHKKDEVKAAPSTRLIIEKVSELNAAKLLTDARYISQTMKLGASLPAYRTFTLEELKEATNNFDASTLMRSDSNGHTCRGKLGDGTLIVIRSLRMRKRRSQQSYTNHIEMFSRLRHSHLVSALGHCFESCLNDSTVSCIYLVFEFVPNGTLRSYISDGHDGKKFNWMQRIAAAIGVAKGMQFLHSGIVPGIFSNNLKIKDVLLDQDSHVKISCYNLLLLAENRGTGAAGVSPPVSKVGIQESDRHACESDVYDMGVILLEMILGRPIDSINDIIVARDLLEASIGMDDAARRSIVDTAVVKECSDESLKKVMEICLRSVSDEVTERPSLGDILWNLQFAAQVQSTVA